MHGESAPLYPPDRWLCAPQNQSGRRGEEQNFTPTRTRTPTPRPSKPVTRRYTDCALQAHLQRVQGWCKVEILDISSILNHKIHEPRRMVGSLIIYICSNCTVSRHNSVYKVRNDRMTGVLFQIQASRFSFSPLSYPYRHWSPSSLKSNGQKPLLPCIKVAGIEQTLKWRDHLESYVYKGR
jgi:hypothetical protein